MIVFQSNPLKNMSNTSKVASQPTTNMKIEKKYEQQYQIQTPQLIVYALACLLGKNEDFLKEINEFKTINNYTQQTKIF